MIKSFEELTDISLEIKRLLPDGGVALLVGDLASGKTSLVKNFVESIGISSEVTSPTFSILNIYDNYVYHYDIYGGGSKKFLQSGLLENLELKGYHFIEWADLELEELLKMVKIKYIKIEILIHRDKREYRIDKCID